MKSHASVKQFGMWLFILSDLLTFSALLITYTALRLANPQWPRPFSLSPAILYSTIMTIVLLASSLTMVWAVDSMKSADRRAAARWLGATILGGIAFIGLHLSEWRHMLQEEFGLPLFSAVFFTITGLHMLHVAGGVIYLGVLAVGVSRGRFHSDDVETGGLYWHFVDLVWMFVFPLVYLMAVKI